MACDSGNGYMQRESRIKKRGNGRYLSEERSVIKTASKPANDSSVTRLITKYFFSGVQWTVIKTKQK